MEYSQSETAVYIGQRLDVFLSQKLQRSRSYVQNLIKRNGVRLIPERLKIQPSYCLRSGDTVVVELENLVEDIFLSDSPQGEEIPLDILYEDDSLLAINKPFGLVVHPAAGHSSGTLVNALVHHCQDLLSRRGGENRLGIVHRLDRDTSGVIIVAKTDRAHEVLSKSFAERDVHKVYRALTWGKFRLPQGKCLGAIGRHPIHRKKMTILKAGGRSAHTDYKVLIQGKFGAEVECVLHTGRTHQIRVHLSSLGHPIWGDDIYGRPHRVEQFLPQRQMLHAARLEIKHPITHEILHLEAPLPLDYQEAKKKLLESSDISSRPRSED